MHSIFILTASLYSKAVFINMLSRKSRYGVPIKNDEVSEQQLLENLCGTFMCSNRPVLTLSSESS